MLKCVYHPVYDFEVVEDEIADEMIASGHWFDHPHKAAEYRQYLEDDIKKEIAPKGKKKRGKL